MENKDYTIGDCDSNAFFAPGRLLIDNDAKLYLYSGDKTITVNMNTGLVDLNGATLDEASIAFWRAVSHLKKIYPNIGKDLDRAKRRGKGTCMKAYKSIGVGVPLSKAVDIINALSELVPQSEMFTITLNISEDWRDICSRFRKRMERNHHNYQQAADKIGVKHDSLWKWVNGKSQPVVGNALKMLKYLE